MYIHPLYHWPPKAQWNSYPSGNFAWQNFSAYIHFPYCRSICEFCGYEKRLIEKKHASSFAEHAVRQIDNLEKRSDLSQARKKAIFFGGGTASLMPTEGLGQILHRLEEFGGGDWSEITLECEPGTITQSQLKQIKDLGVNRIGVCAQSFDDQQLQSIGRKHNAADALRLIEHCDNLGIKNVHVDLMYALPGQSIDLWDKTLNIATDLPISHISAYKLYVFKHSALERNNTKPRAEMETDNQTTLANAMFEMIEPALASAGFLQYTLTEYARRGSECEYVTSCFDGSDVLPIGPSAFGRCGMEVWDNSPYAQQFEQDDFGSEFDRASILSAHEAFKRDVLLGFWLLNINTNSLAAKYGLTPGHRLIELLHELNQLDWLDFSSGLISLDSRHRFWSGFPMERLAKLPSKDWANSVARSSARNIIAENETLKVTQRYAELDSIIRMARRDPDFFNALKNDPISVVQQIGVDPSIPIVSKLIKAVTEIGDFNDQELVEIQLVWKTVADEYLKTRTT